MSPKPGTVRFYIDADLLLLARVLVPLRSDVTYPGDPGGVGIDKRLRPACAVTDPSSPDEEWIAESARQGWVVLTRDRAITRHPAEINAVRDHSARLVILTGEGARRTFDQLEIVLCQWRPILACLDEGGPFIYSITRTTMRRLELP